VLKIQGYICCQRAHLPSQIVYVNKGRENPIFINSKKNHAVLIHNQMPIGNKQEIWWDAAYNVAG
jgi:hypothetical protein